MQQKYSNWNKKVCKKMLVLADFTGNKLIGKLLFWTVYEF